MRILLITLLLASCGKDTDTHHYNTQVETETVVQQFEGSYVLENGGYIELIADDRGDITFESSGQTLVSVNPQNDTLGEHPKVTTKNVRILDGKLHVLNQNYNYSSSTHDIENDTTGANITGRHRTDIVVSKKGEGILIHIKIYQGAVGSNLNSVIAERWIDSI